MFDIALGISVCVCVCVCVCVVWYNAFRLLDINFNLYIKKLKFIFDQF
jgi:hypothetical protein